MAKVCPFTNSNLPQQLLRHSNNRRRRVQRHPRRALLASRVPFPQPAKVKAKARVERDNVPPSGGVVPSPLDAGERPVQPLQEDLAGKTQAFRMASQGYAGYAYRLDLSPECNLLFDSATKYLVGSKERLAYSATLEHYLKIGLVEELPLETSDGLWSTFFPMLKKGTDKMQGCVDLRKPHSCIRYNHFKMEGLHTIQQLIRRDDLITKVDLSDFYVHFLIGDADCRYMRFMREGKKYQCIGMPFGLAPALRLATKMMAPLIRYLQSCGLRVAIYIDDLILHCRSYKEGVAHTQLLVDTLHNLGFGIHPEKAQVIPSRSSEFLGTQVNSKKMQFRVPRDKDQVDPSRDPSNLS